jgi:hypothetical protein
MAGLDVGQFTIRRAVEDDATGFVRTHEAAWNATIAPLVGRNLAELAPFEAWRGTARASSSLRLVRVHG